MLFRKRSNICNHYFIIFFFAFKNHRKIRTIYENQALKRNGTVSQNFGSPLLTFTYKDCPIIVSTYPGSKHKPRFTKVQATVPNPQGNKIKIYNETIASDIGKAFGGQDIHIGNSEFDDKFMIKSNNDLFPTTFLSLSLQKKLLTLRKHHPTVTLEYNQLIINLPKYLKTEEEYDALIDTMLLAVDNLKRS
ncbi:MAG: hypothetical protein QXL17_06270 [Candidatus Thermoplasmatota archaeon]